MAVKASFQVISHGLRAFVSVAFNANVLAANHMADLMGHAGLDQRQPVAKGVLDLAVKLRVYNVV
jgi:hypothetical protein